MKIVTVVGARPQFIKAAPLSRELRREHREVLVHTGQHYDDAMSAVFFRELGVPDPDRNLGVGSGSHGRQTGEMLGGIEEVLMEEKPDLLLVYGDTNSTLAGALAAAKLKIPIAHVEAGVRSYNRAMPEEINRVVTDHVSTLMFCPTPSSVQNLKAEGVTEGVHYVGDVMYDTLLMFLPHAEQHSTILSNLELMPKSYALLTLHRPENVDSDERLTRLIERIACLDLPIIFPAHPRTKKRLESLGLLERLPAHLRVIPPVGYLDMLKLQASAVAVLTDSGGVKREAQYLQVPSIILRPETEWPELVEIGSSRLIGENLEALTTELVYSLPPVEKSSIFGDGDASRKIAGVLNRI